MLRSAAEVKLGLNSTRAIMPNVARFFAVSRGQRRAVVRGVAPTLLYLSPSGTLAASDRRLPFGRLSRVYRPYYRAGLCIGSPATAAAPATGS